MKLKEILDLADRQEDYENMLMNIVANTLDNHNDKTMAKLMSLHGTLSRMIEFVSDLEFHDNFPFTDDGSWVRSVAEDLPDRRGRYSLSETVDKWSARARGPELSKRYRFLGHYDTREEARDVAIDYVVSGLVPVERKLYKRNGEVKTL